MATLFNTKISDTYPGLIKTTDNAAISATLKQLTDGSGNNTGLYINNAGDFKVTAILEWGSLKDTGTGVTITQWVTAANGIANFNNDTTVPTSAAVKTYVDAVVTASDLDFLGDSNTGSPAVDLDSQNFSVLGTANEIVTSGANQTLTIGLPNSVTISGTFTGATFSGDLNGTINTATTAVTQSAGDNSTKVATTAYVDVLDAASDLDFSGDSGTGDVTLNSQVFAITGTTNQITTAASGQGLSLSLPTTIHRNLQGNVTGNVTGDLTGNVTATSVLANGVTATTQSSSDDSTKVATTAYVKGLNNASDLDFTTDSGTGAVVLNTETFSVLGTTNQINSAGSGQAITLSLPSTVHRNLQGNVTGDLTGNADTATKWATARDLSLTGQATGTISSVDGTLNVSGAVTLDNNSVTGKVLTGLPTPASATVLATDSILEGFGKLQSQINGLANGLQFQGAWNATTNSPVLSSGGGEATTGTTTSTTANKLVDSSASFSSTVTVGDKVINQVDRQTALVSNVDSDTILSLDADIMLTGEAYTIDNSPFISQGHYYVVSVGGTTSLNGINTWSVGDWVIAGATNVWEKLDHTDVEGTGTPGNIAKWSATGVIADSIIAESGAAITVTGSLSTTTNLNSGSNFAVATNKFTANATTGNVAFPGDLAINTNKFTVAATSGNTVVGGTLITTGTGTFGGAVRINATTTTGLVISSSSGASNGLKLYNNSSTDNAYIYNHFSGNLEIGTNNATVLTMNGTNSTFAGNVGIGLTPVTGWGASSEVIQLGDGVSDYGALAWNTISGADHFDLMYQSYFDGTNYKYGTNSAAVSAIRQRNGEIFLSRKGGGTADATFTWDDSLKIDSSGNTTFTGSITTTAGTITLVNGSNTRNLSCNGSGNLLISNAANNASIFHLQDDALTLGTTIGTGSLSLYAGAATFAGNTSANAVTARDNLFVGLGQLYIGAENGSTNDTFRQAVGSGVFKIESRESGTWTQRFNIDTNGLATFAGRVVVDNLYSSTFVEAATLVYTSNGSEGAPSYTFSTDANTGIYRPSADTIAFSTGGSNALTLGNNDATFTGNVILNNNTGQLQSKDAAGTAARILTMDNADTLILGNPTTVDDIRFDVDTYGEGAMMIKSSGNVGIQTAIPGAKFSIASGVAKTSTSTPEVLYLGQSNEASNYSALQVYTKGGASQADRKVFFQTIETGVANDGSIILQPSGGNVGIGTDSPSAVLEVFGTGNSLRLDSAANQSKSILFRNVGTGTAEIKTDGDLKLNAEDSGKTIQFFTEDTEKMRITSDGALILKPTGITTGLRLQGRSTDNNFFIQWNSNDGSTNYGSIGSNSGQDALYYSFNNHIFTNGNSGTEYMRIDSSGNVLIAKQSLNIGTVGAEFRANGQSLFTCDGDNSIDLNRLTNEGGIAIFRQAGTVVGNISVTSSATAYNTSSDYRLKEDLQDFAGLDMVSKIPVYNFKWKTDESRSYGVMAHELQEILPQAVVGEKDAEEMQSVDYSKIVPLLVKSIQELKAEVDLLKQECKCK